MTHAIFSLLNEAPQCIYLTYNERYKNKQEEYNSETV